MRKDPLLPCCSTRAVTSLGGGRWTDAGPNGEDEVRPNKVRPQCAPLGISDPDGVVVKDGAVDIGPAGSSVVKFL
jgi:hypothetical protein